MLSHYDIDRA